MNRNTVSHFSELPRADISRSKFGRPAGLKTSFNIGEVIPIYCEEILPGDTVKMITHKVARLQTMLTPVYDNIYLDTYYFFCPNRLVWEHWKQFMGENTDGAWIPQVQYTVPQLEAPEGGWDVGTIADYLGFPTGVDDISVSALPFRCVAMIINEWFRDQNLQDYLNIPLTDVTVTGVNTGNFVTDLAKGGKPFIASKYRDYFTSCLPSPAKGPSVTIGILGDTLPVVGNGYNLGLVNKNGVGYSLRVSDSSVAGITYTSPQTGGYGKEVTDTFVEGETSNALSYLGVPTADQLGDNPEYSGLEARFGAGTGLATINELRTAFQIQKFYERDARSGSRYTEVIRSHFGVVSPDARLQRPEYLGGNRIALNVNQVVQQSASVSGQTAQGTVTGMSLTTDSNFDFTKSFTEHGWLIGLCVARYDHTYQQGIPRQFSRKTKFDYYFPLFANLGEQAVLNKEIFAQGSSVKDSDNKVVDEQVFGFQERWAEYRYKPNLVTGEMRSAYAQSLDVWHLADDYSTLPSLSDSWIREDKTNVDRVLAVTSEVSNQLFADFWFESTWTRPMPMYSVPGLIDHH